MGTLLEVLSPSFLLFPAVLGSVVLGLVCPVVGGFLVLRRSVLLGLALPQLAAAGAPQRCVDVFGQHGTSSKAHSTSS